MSETRREFETVVRIMCERNHGAALNAVIEDYPEIWELIESHTNQAVREVEAEVHQFYQTGRVYTEWREKIDAAMAKIWSERVVEAERRGREEAAKHYITYRGIDYVNCVCGMMLPTRSILVSEAWAQHIIALDPQGKPDTPEGTK